MTEQAGENEWTKAFFSCEARLSKTGEYKARPSAALKPLKATDGRASRTLCAALRWNRTRQLPTTSLGRIQARSRGYGGHETGRCIADVRNCRLHVSSVDLNAAQESMTPHVERAEIVDGLWRSVIGSEGERNHHIVRHGGHPKPSIRRKRQRSDKGRD